MFKSVLLPLIQALGVLSIPTAFTIGLLLQAGSQYEKDFLQTISTSEASFDMANSRQGDILVDAIAHPVSRAVFVPATDAGPRTGAVCAISHDGNLQVYGFGKMSLTKVDLDPKSTPLVTRFCDAAFDAIG